MEKEKTIELVLRPGGYYAPKKKEKGQEDMFFAMITVFTVIMVLIVPPMFLGFGWYWFFIMLFFSPAVYLTAMIITIPFSYLLFCAIYRRKPDMHKVLNDGARTWVD